MKHTEKMKKTEKNTLKKIEESVEEIISANYFEHFLNIWKIIHVFVFRFFVLKVFRTRLKAVHPLMQITNS